MNWISAFRQPVALVIVMFSLAGTPANAQELLANRSLESPLAPANGNNFYATISSWAVSSVVPAQTLPSNIIKPWTGYSGNPTTTPTGGGGHLYVRGFFARPGELRSGEPCIQARHRRVQNQRRFFRSDEQHDQCQNDPRSISRIPDFGHNPQFHSVTSNSIVVTDPTPAGMKLVVTDFAGAGSGPVSFSAGASSLTYTYTSLASASDNVDFSNNSGASWTYAPVTGSDGTDPNVTNIRLRPQGTMAASSTLSFRFRYRIN